MWKAQTTAAVSKAKPTLASALKDDDDDWDNGDFENDVSAKEARWGSKAIEGSGRVQEGIKIDAVREEVVTTHETKKKEEYLSKGTFAFGYGGQFGVHQQTDKAAHDFDSKPVNTQTHSSVPKYEKPAIQGQNSSIRGKFESLAKTTDSEKEQQERIAAERAARAEKERAEREAAKAEQERLEAERKKRQQEEEAREAAQRAAAAEREAAERAEREAAAAAAAAAAAEQEQQQWEEPAAQEQQWEEPAAQEQQWEEPAAAEQAYEQPQETYEQSYEEQSYEQPQETYEQSYEEQPAAAEGYSATAIYEYAAAGEDELSFAEGEVIVNIEFIDEGWWRGTASSTGAYGLFPANYVTLNQ